MTSNIDQVQTKEHLADFIGELKAELLRSPQEWENKTLEDFLEAMEAWVRVIDSYAKNMGDAEVLTPSWKTFAKILCAAKVYE
ncbi:MULTISPECIES: hypothetical protein [unclassified Pseudomonas]|uniref:DUF7660 family protein n=1 Tax=unclassified Pseudomonas TaxID=196821 RepID=UPI0021602D2E|nr:MULTISPECIES: hypothetical protein [unclassified Pseudomonas]UVM49023.1 hypothetical protein LOY38_22050 [Pseudomonas sp. B21-015]WPN56590.1 hypothetical protein QMK51_20975 [Pseudomonas sp. P9_31]